MLQGLEQPSDDNAHKCEGGIEVDIYYSEKAFLP
jgi:hypothetical protein